MNFFSLTVPLPAVGTVYYVRTVFSFIKPFRIIMKRRKNTVLRRRCSSIMYTRIYHCSRYNNKYIIVFATITVNSTYMELWYIIVVRVVLL